MSQFRESWSWHRASTWQGRWAHCWGPLRTTPGCPHGLSLPPGPARSRGATRRGLIGSRTDYPRAGQCPWRAGAASGDASQGSRDRRARLSLLLFTRERTPGWTGGAPAPARAWAERPRGTPAASASFPRAPPAAPSFPTKEATLSTNFREDWRGAPACEPGDPRLSPTPAGLGLDWVGTERGPATRPSPWEAAGPRQRRRDTHGVPSPGAREPRTHAPATPTRPDPVRPGPTRSGPALRCRSASPTSAPSSPRAEASGRPGDALTSRGSGSRRCASRAVAAAARAGAAHGPRCARPPGPSRSRPVPPGPARPAGCSAALRPGALQPSPADSRPGGPAPATPFAVRDIYTRWPPPLAPEPGLADPVRSSPCPALFN
jgi:hypothetical protein